ncbi:5-oxoprolinase subunit PxpA [Psychrobacillus sp. FSL K6-2843]|uniref:LamB/YcsF family protein n=1 Tax=Psychrobacillus sp. FSL K6-2843 TaxID=2921549 RepID=UPI00315A6EA7
MRIDINADVGESFGSFKIGEDEELFKVITSANIACGFHAGDFTVMNSTVQEAKKNNLSIGAHPGFPDKQGFGRRNMNMSPNEIYEMIIYQIGALKAFCQIQNVQLAHVKPHGALYNMAAINSSIARAIARAVYDIEPNAILFGLSNSEIIVAGKDLGLQTAQEAFADRLYDEEGYLVSRTEPNAVLATVEDVVNQALRIVKGNEVKTKTGNIISIHADTLCFHGDGKNVSSIVKKVRMVLEENNVKVAPMELRM